VSKNIDPDLQEKLEKINQEAATKATEVPSETSESNEALDEARKKASENWDLFLRCRADLDNLRRRSQLDVENAHKYGMERFAKELLAVVDSLDQGLSLAKDGDESIQGLREGMILTHKLLLDTLDKFGIKPLDPLGEIFDPARHEALSTQVNTEVAPNKVLLVIQKGFTLQDRLLRPARVIVSKAEEAEQKAVNGS